jgi:holo-[acyl-carrier protein] synthase
MIERFGKRFTSRVFTEAEQEHCNKRRDPFPSFAARFAAKEAVMKALCSGWGSGVRFKEIEVERGERGAPRIKLHGGARERASFLNVDNVLVSLTHEADMALAQAVATGPEQDKNHLRGMDP